LLRIVCLRSPRRSKHAFKEAALRPGAHHAIEPEAWSATLGEVPLPAAVAALSTPIVISPSRRRSSRWSAQHPFHNPTDRVSGEPPHPRDRHLGHLLR
jgi:hypothetical protein